MVSSQPWVVDDEHAVVTFKEEEGQYCDYERFS